MSTRPSTSTTSTTVICGSCKIPNESGAKFCAGCGADLYESCASCGKQVTLAQKFCGSCGTNLQDVLRTRRLASEKMLLDAVRFAKEHDYEEALLLLSTVAGRSDYRLAPLRDRARAAIEKINGLASSTATQVSGRIDRAEAALGRGDHVAVVRELGQVSINLLTPSAERMLADSRQFLQEIGELETEVQNAIQNRDFPWAGGALSRLLVLRPEHPVYIKLAADISRRIAAAAEAMFQKGRFGNAADYLRSIPDICFNDEIYRLQTNASDLLWLEQQFVKQPLANPTLGRLAVRLNQDAPQSNVGKNKVEEIKQLLTRGGGNPRSPWPKWQSPVQPAFELEFDLLGRPSQADWSAVRWPDAAVCRLNVAMGLCISGLGLARVPGNLMPNSSGLLSALKRKRSKYAWGIDVGSSGIRAVQASINPDRKLKVKQLYLRDFEGAQTRINDRNEIAATIRQAIVKMLEEITIGDDPVWVNLGSADVIHHFFRLPPVVGKQAEKLLDLEVSQKIPLSENELCVVRWRADVDGNSTTGIPAMLSATRKTTAARMVELLGSVGLKIAGLQSDSVALVNFAELEFGDVFRSNGNQPDSEGRFPAVALIDCGAQKTSLVIVSKSEHWFGSFEAGGETLTKQIARATKLVRDESEIIKKNPSKIEQPSQLWPELDSTFDRWQSQLLRLREESQKFSRHFKIGEYWCTGGTARTHNFFRRIMQIND